MVRSEQDFTRPERRPECSISNCTCSRFHAQLMGISDTDTQHFTLNLQLTGRLLTLFSPLRRLRLQLMIHMQSAQLQLWIVHAHFSPDMQQHHGVGATTERDAEACMGSGRLNGRQCRQKCIDGKFSHSMNGREAYPV